MTITTLDPKELNAQIVQSAEVAILTLNGEGVVTSWNAAAQRLYGHSAKAVIGKNFTMLMSPDVQLDHAERLRRVSSGQRVEAFTTRHTHQFGHWLNVRIQIGALTTASGTVIGATLFVVPRSAHTELRASLGGTRHDINSATDFALEALSSANLELLEARAQGELMLQAHADCATLTIDLDGRVKTWSSAARRVLGYTAEQIVGQPMEMLYPPEERVEGRPQRALETALLYGRCEEESPRLREDGSRFWARRVLTALRDETGRLVGYAKIIQDLTDTQQLQAKLQRLELGRADAPDAVLLTDADMGVGGTRIVYANHGFETLSGYPLEELIGRTPRLLQGPDTDRAMLERLRKSLEHGGVFVAETTNYRRDRSPYRVRWQILPLRNALGVITHYISIQQDATTHSGDFVTQLGEVVRVTDFLSVRKVGSLRGSLELLGGAGVLMKLLSIVEQSGMLTIGDDVRLQLEAGRIVAVEHPHLIGLEAVLDALRIESGDYGFLAGDFPKPPVPLELCLSVVLLEASRRGASTPSSAAEPVFPSRPALEGLVVLPHVVAAVAFVKSIGVEHFKAALEDVPHHAQPCVVLRGRGFKVIGLEGQMSDVPSEIARA